MNRDIRKLLTDGRSVAPTRVLRSGARPSATAWPGADHRDFGDRIAILAHDYKNHPKETLKLYDPASSKRLIFETKTVEKWVKQANAEIKRIAHLRAIGEYF